MKKISILFCLGFGSLLLMNCRSGLVTMTNGCYKSIEAGKADNQAGNYSAAVDQFNQVLSKCDAYDAKEQANAGKAEAYNGLKQYNDALAAANEGLKINKSSVDNLFQKANAELGLKMNADAKADLAQIIDLTQKNKNTKDRATIYAKMAEIDLKQNMYSDAMNNVETAISSDNTNADFYILKGDIYTAQNDYANASSAYDQAISYGSNNAKAWNAKIEAEVKSYQQKYSTGSNAADLAGKISAADKKALCSDITQAKKNGVKNANIDLLRVSICK
ncbi:MAG: tetratricopeptide repeat protein [Parafilimonas sp.]